MKPNETMMLIILSDLIVLVMSLFIWFYFVFVIIENHLIFTFTVLSLCAHKSDNYLNEKDSVTKK